MARDIFDERAELVAQPSSQPTDIFAKRAEEIAAQRQPQTTNLPTVQRSEADQPQDQRGIIPSFERGLSSGVGGLMTGHSAQTAPQEESWPEHLASLAGQVVSDIPGFVAGGLAGGAVGGPIGSAAGAMAVPTLIKKSFSEYEDYMAKGGQGSFGDYLDRAGRIAKETGKAGLLGAATGQVSKFLPALSKIPGLRNILSTTAGLRAAKGALELGTLTGGQAALEGRMPTWQEAADNAAVLAGLAGARKITGAMTKPGTSLLNEAAKLLPEKASESTKRLFGLNPRQKQFFSILKDHVGEQEARVVESQFAWNKALADAGPITKDNLNDMIYYRQKTGNPLKPGDSFEALEKRLPANAKKLSQVIDHHLQQSLDTWNKNPITRKINPREGLEEIYLPGLYEYDAKSLAEARKKLPAQFTTKNPFADSKAFLTYAEAYEKAGLKPRYDNIVDMVKAYDRTMIKSLANTQLIDQINKMQTESGQKYLIGSHDKAAYEAAKDAGYIPFEDPFLRYNAPSGPSFAPALVHPDFANVFKGIFSKRAYEPQANAARYYDAASSLVRGLRVRMSPFHFVALTEHAVPALKSINIPAWLHEGNKLRANKEFMMDAARSGLQLHDVEGVQKGTLKNYQTNLKAITWQNWSDKMINKLAGQGNPPDAEQIKNIKRDMAEFVNNLYGGQNWKTMALFNDPKTMQLARRAIAYPDWTTSAIRNAASIFKGGPVGEASRQTWFNYALFYFGTRALINSLFSSLVQTDPEKKPSGIRLDPKKAWENLHLVGKGPEQWHEFPLPDIDVNIAGHTFNPGRDAKGHKLYGHLGKSAIEIGHYFEKPVAELFSKSNPIAQMAFKQLFGATPSGEGMYPVQGVYRQGRQVPWSGKRGIEQVIARGEEALKDIAPFSIRSPIEQGIEGLGQYVGSLGGAFPVSKGLTLHKAEPYIEDALRNNNARRLNELQKLLIDNGFAVKEIKKRITTIRRSLKQ